MATLNLLPFLFFSFTASFSAAQSRASNNITVGFSLSTNTSHNFLSSPSGRFAFGFYPERGGFKVGIWISGIQNITVVWTAYRDDMPAPDGSTLTLTGEGIYLGTQTQNLIMYNGNFRSVSFASMLDSGNFVLYGLDSDIIWQTFDYASDTILGGQVLRNGASLYSSVNESDHSMGRFHLSMQTDGNLVLYPANTEATGQYAYWSTATYREGITITLNLDADGYLCLRNGKGVDIVNLTNGSASVETELIYRATLGADGILRLYSHSFGRNGSSNISVIWTSNKNSCEIKGYCGSNSYCALMDTEPTCLCPPGFDYVDPNYKLEGCVRNSTEPDCGGNKEKVTYSISILENLGWEDTPYTSSPVGSAGECRRFCLEDCNCQVARWHQEGGTCW